jgi:hypothetical protein
VRLEPACPWCDATGARAILRFEHAPVTCAAVFDTREAACAVPSGVVDLRACAACGFVFNAAFDATLAELGARYESSQAASARFVTFARDLAGGWIQRHGLSGERVFEVGCGHGDFLDVMARAGVREAIGFDPLGAPRDTTVAGAKVAVVARAFDASTPDVPARALICRHTLEHIAQPRAFLRAVHAWAARVPDRVVLFELPDTDRIVDERAFWDVYHEHCAYYTAPTLRAAFERSGFEVLEASKVFDDQYLIIEARAAPKGGTPRREHAVSIEPIEAFGRDVHAAVSRCARSLQRLAADGEGVVLWQGASKTVGFLAALGDAARHVSMAVDASPARHGKFLPGTGLPVHDPAVLAALQPPHVVLMNAVYEREVRAQLERLSPSTRLHLVNDLLRGV